MKPTLLTLLLHKVSWLFLNITVYIRIKFPKSPASGAGNNGESRLMSQVERMREIMWV